MDVELLSKKEKSPLKVRIAVIRQPNCPERLLTEISLDTNDPLVDEAKKELITKKNVPEEFGALK